jgi:hypothetical protein
MNIGAVNNHITQLPDLESFDFDDDESNKRMNIVYDQFLK